MKKLTTLLATALMLVGLAVPQVFAQCVVSEDDTGVRCFTLYAGQHIDAGTVCVEVVNGNLEVVYTTIDGWELIETHMWVGGSLADLPTTNKGNPIPGQFPYASGDITGATSYTFEVGLDVLAFECPGEDQNFYVAAHAALGKQIDEDNYQTQTGWSEGDRIAQRGNWGTYSTFTLSCDCNGGGGVIIECQTAYAVDVEASQCFLDIEDLGANRWGWTNGPYDSGDQVTLDIYAGAAQCDLEKGTYVGTLDIDYQGSTLYLTFDMVDDNTLNEVHIYVGEEILPRDKNGDFTVAPGQYTVVVDNLGGVDSYEHILEGITGPIYVIGHAVVCWPK